MKAATLASFSPFLLSLSLFCSNVWAEDHHEQIRALQQLVVETGSHTAQAEIDLLKHKHRLDKDPATDFDTFSQNLSKYTLGNFSQIGLDLSSSENFHSEVGLLTGGRAIDESLQLESVDGVGLTRSRPDDDNVRKIAVTGVPGVEVKSHPWPEMLAKEATPKIPQISALVPKDYFFVYAPKFSSFLQLEDGLKAALAGGKLFFDIDSILDARRKVSERLGVTDLNVASNFVEECAFVSQDLDFYPANHYAVILKLKPGVSSQLASLIVPARSFSSEVGEYFVIATSQEVLDQIKATAANSKDSLSQALDFHYTLTQLNPNRDISVYFSDDFIRKLVSPTYRINAGRRLVALGKLEALQYVVLAMKSITGALPSSFADIVKQGYIADKTVDPEYRIDSEGVVQHSIWGTIKNPKALSEVPISLISVAEEQRYSAFRAGYQSYWREFFDPIGLGIQVGDQISVHTVILPLIDNSEYRNLIRLAGGPATEFSLLKSGNRIPSMFVVSKFNFENLVLSELGGRHAFDGQTPEAIEQKKNAINQDIQNQFKLAEKVDVFDLFGDEIMIGASANQAFEFNSLADVDVFAAIKLKNRAAFENFTNSVYRSMFTQRNRGGFILPFIQVSSEKPLSNEYKGEKYYTVPGSFLNLLWYYHGDTVYFAINQLTMNRIIDAKKDGNALSPLQNRGLAFTGDQRNILFSADFSEAQKLRDQVIKEGTKGYSLSTNVRSMLGYLTDIDRVVKASGPAMKLESIFNSIPQHVYGVPVAITAKGVTLGGVDVGEVNSGLNYYFPSAKVPNQVAVRTKPFESLIPPSYIEGLLKSAENFRSLSIGLSFTAHGLDTKVAIANPLIKTEDSRVVSTSSPEKNSIPWALVGVIVAVFAAGFALMKLSGGSSPKLKP